LPAFQNYVGEEGMTGRKETTRPVPQASPKGRGGRPVLNSALPLQEKGKISCRGRAQAPSPGSKREQKKREVEAEMM